MPRGILGIVVLSGLRGVSRRGFLTAPPFLAPTGLKESPVIPLAESELLADILEEVRKAIGVTFPQDKR